MRITIAVAMLAASVSAAAADGYWSDANGQTWRNSAGECWQTGTISKEQAAEGCDPKPKAAPAPVVVAKPAPAPAPVVPPPPPPKPVDTDGDGVIDANDKCANTKKGAKINASGCVEVLTKEQLTRSIDVKFASGKTTLDAQYDAEVKKLADFMNEYPNTTVEIAGHTDSSGAAAVNRKLSQARADAVRKALVEKFGVDGARVTAKGYGPDKPIADNKTPAGRAANRRVEGVVTQTVEKVEQQ